MLRERKFQGDNHAETTCHDDRSTDGSCRLQSRSDPPSVDDAKATWNSINKQSGLTNDLQLVDLKKTDGQFAEVNGVKVYTLFYEARQRYLTKVGHWKPGDVETIHSNYGFQKTESGWQGPDGTHFKD